jgi:hypothetical protein
MHCECIAPKACQAAEVFPIRGELPTKRGKGQLRLRGMGERFLAFTLLSATREPQESLDPMNRRAGLRLAEPRS